MKENFNYDQVINITNKWLKSSMSTEGIKIMEISSSIISRHCSNAEQE